MLLGSTEAAPPRGAAIPAPPRRLFQSTECEAGLLQMILNAACPDLFPSPARTTGGTMMQVIHGAASGADGVDSSNSEQEGGGRGASPASSLSRYASEEKVLGKGRSVT